LGNDKCQKIVHFILADIEGIFPAFAGDVSLESVKMGHGGTSGLDFFKPNSAPGLVKQSGLMTVEAHQLEHLHGFYKEMKALLVQKNEKADSPEELYCWSCQRTTNWSTWSLCVNFL